MMTTEKNPEPERPTEGELAGLRSDRDWWERQARLLADQLAGRPVVPTLATPEPARDGGGAVAADRRLPDSIERALCDVFSAVLNNAQYEVACRKVADAAGPLRDAILYELRAAPPAAVGRGEAAWPVGSLIRLGDDPFGRGERAVWYRSEDGSECYVWLQHLSLAQRARIGVPDAAPAGGDVAASQPAPSSAQVGSSGGDVAAAVGGEAVAALMEQHRSWCEMYGGFGASSPWSRDVGLLLTALTTERAAHEAAVRAAREEVLAAVAEGLTDEQAAAVREAMATLASRMATAPDDVRRLNKSIGHLAGALATERARAEALGADLAWLLAHAAVDLGPIYAMRTPGDVRAGRLDDAETEVGHE